MTSPPTHLSLVDLLEASVQKHGSRPLFVTKRGEGLWGETTYGEFASQVDRMRGGLASLGVRAKDRVGIIANNSIEWAVIAYATYGLGATLVPMYESQLAKERAFITADSGIKVVFTAAPEIHREALALRASIPALQHVVLLGAAISQPGLHSAPGDYSSLLAEGDRHPVASVHPQPGETACLLYTSGTTGDPKGVILSHRNVVSNVLALKAIIPTVENDRTLSILPWAHSFGHTVELHGIIAAGASIAIAEAIDKILDDLQAVKPTILVAVPRVFLRVHAGVEQLMEGRAPLIKWLFRRGLAAAKTKTKGESLGPTGAAILFLADKLVFSKVRARFGGRLKYAVSGGAAMPREVAEFIDGIGIEVYEGYGLTEASPIVSANVPGSRKLGSVGRLLPGVRVVIDRSQTNDARHGEIVVYGPNVTQGYHNRDEENRATFTADGGLRTGDMGHLDEDDFLFITGRIKEQYKLTNGKYVVPGPLEDRLKLSPFIASIMIYGDNKAYNVALVVPDEARLLEWAAKQGLGGLNLSDLVAKPKVEDKIRSEIDNLSSAFKGYERVKAFALIVEDFTQENDMLTPSLKLKRRNIVQRWSRQLDRLYPQRVVVDENRI